MAEAMTFQDQARRVRVLAASEITIRGYRPGDLDAMFRLDVVCFDPPFRFSRAAMRRFAEAGNARVLLADAGGNLAGFCIVHVETDVAQRVGYIVTLDVDPGQRRLGVGRHLMAAAEVEGRAAGCGALALHVFTGNAGATQFYEELGYVRLQRATGFYGRGGDAWAYRKQLAEGTQPDLPISQKS